jgi:RHS repeat-associated protein
LDGSNTVVSTFIYGTRSNVPDYMIQSGTTYRIITDHLGSPRVVADVTTGAVAQNLGYDEFGNVLADTNPAFQPFAFAGGLYDPDTGLVRFGARDYDPRVGRWTVKDPIGFEGSDADLYAYVGNDPINLVDEDGLKVHPANFVGPLQPGDRIETPADAAASWALSHVGDTNYTYLSPHSESKGHIASPLGGRKAYKCNAFVWDALKAGGAAPGRMPGGRIPSAADWGSKSILIPGYHLLTPGVTLQSGDVIGDGVHVGIYYPLGSTPQTISAPPTGGVVANDWGFRPGQQPTVHRCDCAGH